MLTRQLTEEQTKEVYTIMTTLTEYIDRSDLENPHLGPDANELDSVTALEFVEKRLAYENYSEFKIDFPPKFEAREILK